MSLDHWSAPESSKCYYRSAPDLSVNFICAHPRPDDEKGAEKAARLPPDKAAAARFQEVFVDYVGMQCASLDAASRHVLDDRFDSFLGKGEREFKQALMALMHDSMTEDARRTPAFRALDEMLRSKMGFRNTYFWHNRKSNYYERKESGGEERADYLKKGSILSQLLVSDGTNEQPSEATIDAADPRTEVLRGVLDDIQSNAKTCRLLRLSGKEAPEEKTRSILRECVSEEDLDALFASLNNPSYREESKLFRSLLCPPGHVFVCNASVCDLHCDAFLCPGSISPRKHSISGTIAAQWRKSVRQNAKLERHVWPYKFKRFEKYTRVMTHRDWPWEEIREGRMAPVPFFVGGEVSLEKSRRDAAGDKAAGRLPLPSSEEHVAALMETADQFIDVALEELREHQPEPLAGRERYLLAMPVLGTGGGFAGDLTGQVVGGLLSLMSDRAYVEGGDLDMVLVCADEATYAHAQSIRSNLMRESDEEEEEEGAAAAAKEDGEEARRCSGPVPSVLPCFRLWLTDQMRDQASQLAELASTGHLALFLGAGVSMGSGLPGWFGLLHVIEDLFTANGTPAERKLGNATKWNPLVMADLLDGICSSRPDRNGVRASLKSRLCECIDEYGRRPGLLLSLLVSLPCQSVVTQNYDRLIERAFECWSVGDKISSKTLSVIPYRPRRNAQHWLLKMHGCTSACKEIVISGKDYEQYDSSRYKALGGLLQASLMTKHLLFVGFSLTDPNYLNMVEQVRKALHDDSSNTNAPIGGSKRISTV